MAVADAYGVITTDCYGRRAAQARDEIQHYAGVKFDPQIVAALERVLDFHTAMEEKKAA